MKNEIYEMVISEIKNSMHLTEEQEERVENILSTIIFPSFFNVLDWHVPCSKTHLYVNTLLDKIFIDANL